MNIYDPSKPSSANNYAVTLSVGEEGIALIKQVEDAGLGEVESVVFMLENSLHIINNLNSIDDTAKLALIATITNGFNIAASLIQERIDESTECDCHACKEANSKPLLC